MRFFKFANESAIWRRIALCMCVASMPLASPAEPMHAIAMYGEPALPPGFSHLPYANPDAPKGGTIRLAETGTFDSLNPWILMGNPVWPIFTQPGLVTESLMARSIDEPSRFTACWPKASRPMRIAAGSSSPCAPRRAFRTAPPSPSRT